MCICFLTRYNWLITDFNTMLFRDLIEHYKITNYEAVRYFIKRFMANMSKPTSVNSIYNDLKSQGQKISKDKMYELADYVCEIFLFFSISRYERSLIKDHNPLPNRIRNLRKLQKCTVGVQNIHVHVQPHNRHKTDI